MPKFASRKKLERILEKCLDEEEEQERRRLEAEEEQRRRERWAAKGLPQADEDPGVYVTACGSVYVVPYCVEPHDSARRNANYMALRLTFQRAS